MKEVWKHIPGAYSYEVSTLGNVRNAHAENVKPSIVNGIPTVHVTKDGGSMTSYAVHSLVLRSFAPSLWKRRIRIVHKDGDINNSALDNLCVLSNGALIPVIGEQATQKSTTPNEESSRCCSDEPPVLHRYELICRDRLQMAGMMVQRYEGESLVGYKAPDGSIYALTVSASSYSEKLENAIALLHNEAIQHTVKWLDEVVKEEE